MPLEQFLTEIDIQTSGEGFTDITPLIDSWVKQVEITKGVIHLSALHTSCSLIINENADPRVLEDLSTYMKALVPNEGIRKDYITGNYKPYLHAEEGIDDMPAHIRTSLTNTTLSLSINSNKLILGTWQAIYLWEHRYSKYTRKVCLHAIGERQHNRGN